MEIIFIILTSTIMSALFLVALLFGYAMGKTHIEKEGLTVTDKNKQAIEEMIEWKSFDGRR